MRISITSPSPSPSRPSSKSTHLDPLLRHQPPERRHARLVLGAAAAPEHHQLHPPAAVATTDPPALALALLPLGAYCRLRARSEEARKGADLEGVVLLRAELADGEDDGLAGREGEVLCCWCWGG